MGREFKARESRGGEWKQVGVVPVVVVVLASSTAEEGGRHRAAWRAQDGHGGHSEEQLQKEKTHLENNPLASFPVFIFLKAAA